MNEDIANEDETEREWREREKEREREKHYRKRINHWQEKARE